MLKYQFTSRSRISPDNGVTVKASSSCSFVSWNSKSTGIRQCRENEWDCL